MIRLERNYRSTGHILGAASGVIAHNRARHGKTLWTEDEAGEPVRVAGLWDDQEEARFVADEVEAWQRQGGKLSQTAVLVRAGFQTRAFEERFIQLGLPYRVIGGPRFYERAEIRDAIAYLPRGLPAGRRPGLRADRQPAAARHRRQHAAQPARAPPARPRPACSRPRAALVPDRRAAGPRPQRAAPSCSPPSTAGAASCATRPPRELAEIVLEEFGYTAMWQADRSPDAPGPAGEPEGAGQGGARSSRPCRRFLEHVSLVMENAAEPDADLVSVMTLHGAKGLEFDNVFLCRLGGGAVPEPARDRRGRQQGARGGAAAGLCRHHPGPPPADHQLRRQPPGLQPVASSVPSRFVEELPPEHIEHLHRNPATRPDLGTFLDERAVHRAAASRFRSRRAELGKVIEGRAEILQSRPARAGPAPSSAGDRIFHDKFGYGQVEVVDGNKLDIAFEKSGRKKVIDSFVQAA